MEGLDKTSILRGVCWERGGGGVTFCRGVCNPYIKNKLKSEIFNDKNIYKKKFFYVITN